MTPVASAAWAPSGPDAGIDVPAVQAYSACMRRKPTRQYTIRSVPEAVDRALRREARRRNKSLNEVALAALYRGIGLNSPDEVHHDLDHLIGTWEADPTFDAALRAQDTVDKKLWR